MLNRFMSRPALQKWLQTLMADHQVVAPVREEGLILFRPVKGPEEVALDYQNTTMSPKEWFFPLSEAIFSYRREDNKVILEPKEAPQEVVLFGIRPCDARGLAVLDKPFFQAPADGLYAQRRERATLVGLACRDSGPACFCDSMGGGPADEAHVDVMLTEVKEGYIVKAVTTKGAKLLISAQIQEGETTEPAIAQPKAVQSRGIAAAMRRQFDSDYWSKVGDRCLHCNICAYVCPTCYCFDIRDFPVGDRIERVRSWDSCQSPAFTRIAGGYERRPSKGERMRQRFAHKLLYFPGQWEGVLHCVGCGRCVTACPVNIDIREVIEDVNALPERPAAAEKGGDGHA